MNQKVLRRVKDVVLVVGVLSYISVGYLGYENYTLSTELENTKKELDFNKELAYNVNKKLDKEVNLLIKCQEELRESDSKLKSKQMWYPQEMELTFYTTATDECGKDDGITANGATATAGRTIASNSLPIGTKVMIEDNVYTVEDTGGIDYNTLDVLVATKEEAYTKGRYTTTVYILK